MVMRNTLVWLLLVVLTGLTWWAGKFGGGGQWLASLLLVSVFTKGHFVVADFMALRHAALHWRLLVQGWLVLVLLLIFVAYQLGN